MSRPSLPQEIADDVVDLLHDERDALKACCLVSRSWVPRTRRYLFREVAFDSSDAFVAWDETFPDPNNSPGYYTHSLSLSYPHDIVVAKKYVWVRREFHNVVRLKLWSDHDQESWSVSSLLTLVCSLPLLEDLDVDCYSIRDDTAIFRPPTSPPLTGTLKLSLGHGTSNATSTLLELPNGIHFRKIECSWQPDGDFWSIADVVDGCSDTLECIEFNCKNLAGVCIFSIDFSDSKRLKEVTFRLVDLDDSWFALALRTLTSEHRDLHQISIHIPEHTPEDEPELREWFREEWVEIDHTLVRLYELHAVHIRLICVMEGGKEKECERLEKLLPEVMKRGIYELVDCDVLC